MANSKMDRWKSEVKKQKDSERNLDLPVLKCLNLIFFRGTVARQFTMTLQDFPLATRLEGAGLLIFTP